MSIVGSVVQGSGGGGGVSITEVSTAVDYTIVATGNVRVYVDTTSTAVSITLPTGAAGQEVEIVDAGENAGTNIITIVGTIDGATNATIQADSASRKVVYSGTAWETTGGVDQFFKRNAATGVISSKAPDALSADRIDAGDSGSVYGGLGVSEFSNAEANVDQGGSAWSNRNDYSTEFNSGNKNTNATTPYTVIDGGSDGGYEGWRAFSASGIAALKTGKFLAIDLGTSQKVSAIKVGGYAGGPSTFDCTSYTVYGSNTSISGPWTSVGGDSDLTPIAAPSFHPILELDDSIAYRYIKVLGVTPSTYWQFRPINLYFENLATTNNTFQQRFLTSGGSVTFAPSTLVLKDIDGVDLTNGQVTIEYSTDNGSNWSSSYGLDAFKALGNIIGTSFWLRYALVGSATMKSGRIQSTATYASMTATGLDVLVDSASIGGITAKGIVPVSLTTAERDALTGVAAGAMIFNETTGKLNFYTGSAWEVITSA